MKLYANVWGRAVPVGLYGGDHLDYVGYNKYEYVYSYYAIFTYFRFDDYIYLV